MSLSLLPANYTNSAVINSLNDGVVDFTTEQDGQGLKIINNTTSGYLEVSSGGAIVSPDGVATYTINFKDLSAITTNTTPQELVVVNTIAVQDATTTPPNNIQIQAGVIGVGTNFGIEYSSSTDQDFTIFCDENNTGGVVFKQLGFGATTTQTKINQGVIVSSDTANANAITINPTTPSITITDGTNTNTITAVAGGSNNLQSVLTAGNTATGASAKIGLTDSGVGGSANPQLTLNNSNATAGNTNGVPLMEYYKSGRNVVANDIVSSQRFNANNYLGTKTPFGRIDCVATSSSAGAGDDGALDFYTCVNGASSLVMRLNGADNENNTFRPFDLNGNNLKTSSGNMTIETTASTGTGTISLTPKTGAVVDIAGNATLTGTRQIDFGGGTTITNTINRTGLLIQNNTASPDITQSIYQDANCNLVQIDTSSTNSQYFNTSTPQNQTIRRMDLTSGSDIQKNQSTLVQQRLDYTDIATGDQSSIRLENDLASLNNVIAQNYTTGAGAVLETILQTTPYGTHRLSMTNNNTGFSTQLNTTQLFINDIGNNKSITIDNNPSSIQNRIDLFKNDGGGIYTQLAVANSTSNQILSLSHSDNGNDKTISFSNNRGGAGSIAYNNIIDTNGLTISSNQAITMSGGDTANVSAGSNVNITSTGSNINMYASAGGVLMDTTSLTFTGASLQSNTSSGNSGEHLVITLNGNQYKIALQNP